MISNNHHRWELVANWTLFFSRTVTSWFAGKRLGVLYPNVLWTGQQWMQSTVRDAHHTSSTSEAHLSSLAKYFTSLSLFTNTIHHQISIDKLRSLRDLESIHLLIPRTERLGNYNFGLIVFIYQSAYTSRSVSPTLSFSPQNRSWFWQWSHWSTWRQFSKLGKTKKSHRGKFGEYTACGNIR